MGKKHLFKLASFVFSILAIASGCNSNSGSSSSSVGDSTVTAPVVTTPDSSTPNPPAAGDPSVPAPNPTGNPTSTPTSTPTGTPVPSQGKTPAASFLPVPTGACPTFANGDVTFSPKGIKSRKVRIWMNPSAVQSKDGPLVYYWHSTGNSPAEAVTGLSQTVIDEIIAAGGIVAAPYSDPEAGTYPWFLTTNVGASARQDDLLVADEILGCARQQLGIDTRRIHSVGFSAGALQTTQMSYRRSGYLASVVTYSGGLATSAPARQDPSNRFAALIFDGGPSDVVVMSFQVASEKYWNELNSHSQFAIICDRGLGHKIPTEARSAVWAFFQAHPFGTDPSPYASGLPGIFPSYCGLAP